MGSDMSKLQKSLGLLLFVFALAAARLSVAEENLPVAGRAVFDAGKLSAFHLASERPGESFSVVSVTGQPFRQAFRVRVAAKHAKAWDVQILTPAEHCALEEGRACPGDVERPLRRVARGRRRFLAPIIQASGPKWIGIGSTDVVAGKEWTRVYIHGQAAQDFAAGKYELTLHLGSQIQTLEIGGIAMLNLGPNVDVEQVALHADPLRRPGARRPLARGGGGTDREAPQGRPERARGGSRTASRWRGPKFTCRCSGTPTASARSWNMT